MSKHVSLRATPVAARRYICDLVLICAHECEGERLSMIVGVTLERMLDDGLEFRGGREGED